MEPTSRLVCVKAKKENKIPNGRSAQQKANDMAFPNKPQGGINLGLRGKALNRDILFYQINANQ
jgi:hypothetical protein